MTHVTVRGFSQKNSHKSDDAARVHIFVYYVCFAGAIFECLQQELILMGSCRRMKHQAILLDIFSYFSNTIKKRN
ncbi:hypothetical protein LSAT2_023651 [Lamellibrachia satsuma]|nr:hypothetical protein LSAT2_023651 [Lamellibrachia satsuma]